VTLLLDSYMMMMMMMMIMITEQPAAVAQKTGYDTDVQGLSQAQR
jgi:hypothetical protein